MEKFNNKIEKHLELYERLQTVKVLLKPQKTLMFPEKLVNDGSNNIMKMALMDYFQIIQIVAENHT